MSRPPLPPFAGATATQKARMAEDAWNSRDPARVALAYTEDSRWRNRSEFLQGRPSLSERRWTSCPSARYIWRLGTSQLRCDDG